MEQGAELKQALSHVLWIGGSYRTLYRILVKLFLADFDRTDLLENNVYVR